MAQTAHLGITLVEQAQAQKEVTVNEAFGRIDAWLNNGAIASAINTPPTTPAAGDVYVIGASPTGAWVGHNKEIAYFDQVWRFITPRAGSTVWMLNLNQFQVFSGTDWGAATPSLTGTYSRMLEVTAADMRPMLTGGCAPLAQLSLGAGKPDILTLDFDATTQEYAVFSVSMPQAWDAGAVTAQVLWSHATASGSYGVVWSLQSLARGDNELLGGTYGTATTQADTGGVADRLYVSPVTAAIAPNGTASAGNLLLFRLSRATAHASDTLTTDARLHSVRLFYGVTGLQQG
jgi:Protein of unknown function (DUF2793)